MRPFFSNEFMRLQVIWKILLVSCLITIQIFDVIRVSSIIFIAFFFTLKFLPQTFTFIVQHWHVHISVKNLPLIPKGPKSFEKVISLWRYPFVEIIFYENQNGICFLWDIGLWILTIQPSHSYTLAYCRPIHLTSIEFQNIDNDHSSPPKKIISYPSTLMILQSVRSLWVRLFLHSIGILRYKILWLKVEKHHFILIIGPHVNKYMFKHVLGPIFTKMALKF
jgi:hypothetical protein